ncbi:unnamed protein product [Lathyrus oleraceus]
MVGLELIPISTILDEIYRDNSKEPQNIIHYARLLNLRSY